MEPLWLQFTYPKCRGCSAAAPCGKGGMLWSSGVLVNRAAQPLLGHNTSVSVRAMSCVGREI